MDLAFVWKIKNMSNIPKVAWKSVNALKDWIYGHHKTPIIMKFQTSDNSFTATGLDNIVILTNHFTRVFNSNVNIDWSVLEDLRDKP